MDDSMIEEFKIEAQEMFETSEDGFLKIENGEDFTSNYNLIFRAFHSLKGAAGMFGIDDLQAHMHKLESLFEAQKNKGKLDKAQIDYFLAGIDAAKSLLDGNKVSFKYYSIEEFNQLTSLNSESIAKNEATPVSSTEKISNEIREKRKDSTVPKKGLFFIVDDEEAILHILNDLITDMGFECKTFDNAKDLMSSMEDSTPDVLLSDIRMPEMDGLQLLNKLREENYDIPVIFISGYISKEVMLEALEHGAYGFVEKPFNEVYLKTLCENAMTKVKIQKLLHKSINYILYQFADLDNYLKEQGKETLRQSLKSELTNILEQQKILKQLNKNIPRNHD